MTAGLRALAAAVGTAVVFALVPVVPVGADDASGQAHHCDVAADELLAGHVTSVAGVAHLPAGMVEVCGHRLLLAELEDLRLLATERGVDLAEVLRRYGWQQEFATVADALERRFPEHYAGAAFDGPERSWVAFKGQAPSAAATVIGALPITVVEHRGFSEAELRAVMVETFGTLAERDDVDSAAGSYDQETGAVAIDVVAADAAAAERIAAESWSAPSPAIAVSVNIVDAPAWGPDARLRGGAAMNTSRCTAGFGVRHADGRTGLAYAHHCASIRGAPRTVYRTERYHSPSDSTSATLRYRDRRAGSAGDMAWYGSSGHRAGSSFYSAPGRTRSVAGTARPRVGQRLFNYGRNGGQSTHQVYRLNQCIKPEGYPQYCGLAAMNRRTSQPGDSGGPWYYGNTAYGIHSGWKTINGHQRALFTPVDNLPRGMNVSVVTSPLAALPLLPLRLQR